jgi:hypothetical protein
MGCSFGGRKIEWVIDCIEGHEGLGGGGCV